MPTFAIDGQLNHLNEPTYFNANDQCKSLKRS